MRFFSPPKTGFPFLGLAFPWLSPCFPPAFPVLSLCGVRLSPRFSSACPLLGLCFRRRLRARTWSQDVTLQHQANHIAWYSCYILFLLHNYGFPWKETPYIQKRCKGGDSLHADESVPKGYCLLRRERRQTQLCLHFLPIAKS